jgi:hypothetical protein
MQSFIKFLQGKKTYIGAAVAIATGVSAYLKGNESFTTALTSIPGVMVYLGGLASTLRAAFAKIEAVLKTSK